MQTAGCCCSGCTGAPGRTRGSPSCPGNGRGRDRPPGVDRARRPVGCGRWHIGIPGGGGGPRLGRAQGRGASAALVSWSWSWTSSSYLTVRSGDSWMPRSAQAVRLVPFETARPLSGPQGPGPLRRGERAQSGRRASRTSRPCVSLASTADPRTAWSAGRCGRRGLPVAGRRIRWRVLTRAEVPGDGIHHRLRPGVEHVPFARTCEASGDERDPEVGMDAVRRGDTLDGSSDQYDVWPGTKM